jgi:hypothetical protein
MSTSGAVPLAPTIAKVGRAHGRGLVTHILPTSATMIGVCMTVLTIGHLGPAGELRLVVDKLLATDALIFLISALLSFVSMRSDKLIASYEARAELIFMAGLILLAIVAIVLAFAIT